MIDAGRGQFWQAASLLAPPLAAILPPAVVWLAGGFEGFEWVDKTPTPFQVFGMLGAMFFPFAAYFFAQMKANQAMARQSRSWPTVPGRIVTREIKDRATRYSILYALDVTYSYEVAGQRYSGDTLGFAPRWLDSRALVEQLAAKYPPNTAVAVHVDPRDPQNAVLETSEALAGGRMTRVWLFTGGPFFFALLAFVLPFFQS